MSATPPQDSLQEPSLRHSDADGEDEPSSAPSSASDRSGPQYQAGDIIAQKYRLTRILGEGGMGAVWLARNMKLDVDVAIKLIRHEVGTAEGATRLLQEARAAARIGHRSIVRIFDFGETELDDPFIVMEVLSGESLRDVLDRKSRLPAANAVRTLLPIASALAEAHASGVVHRDLKPENVMLMPDKSGGVVPKLVDFGIAKFRSVDEDPEDAPSGFVVGTPSYMAPEQAGGRDEVSEPADVWALSVILYEALTGRVPFTGTNLMALSFAIMTEEPTPVHDQLAGDAELWHILQSGLAKLQKDRPGMRAFGTALAEWALARGIDSDITGTSLEAHWLGDAHRSPFSALPPPVAEDRATPSEIAIPRPAAVPSKAPRGRQAAATELPPEPRAAEAEKRPAGRGVAWGFAAIALAAAVALFITRGRTSPPAAPAAQMTSAPSAPAPLDPRPAPPVTAAPSADPTPAPTDTTSPRSDSSAIEPPPPASASALPLRQWKNPRKSRLPIAKQPNF